MIIELKLYCTLKAALKSPNMATAELQPVFIGF